MRALIITGLSGSGKTSVVRALEDSGFYCVDNLPVSLLRPFIELSLQPESEVQKLAFVIDARDQANITQLPETLKSLSGEGHTFEILFLTASNDSLTRRFSETRRRHPLSPKGSVMDGINEERALLQPIHDLAGEVFDTSQLTVHELRSRILDRFGQDRGTHSMNVQVLSFGFKYSLPVNADLVLDVRFLPNPFFQEHLKAKTGQNKEVQKFVLEQSDSKQLLDEYSRLLSFLLPRYEHEGKSYLVIAVGCTGGKHRSVALSEELQKRIEKMDFKASAIHRDLARE